MVVTGPRWHPEALDTHEALARLLTADQRAWLARMADVLPWGWVVTGMAIPRRGDVVTDPGRPSGLRLIVAPAGPAGVGSDRRILGDAVR